MITATYSIFRAFQLLPASALQLEVIEPTLNILYLSLEFRSSDAVVTAAAATAATFDKCRKCFCNQFSISDEPAAEVFPVLATGLEIRLFWDSVSRWHRTIRL